MTEINTQNDPACGGVIDAQPISTPNIILILVDDMGFSDLGCYGSEIQTPTLNRLAENSVRFTHMYNGARCCPARASLLTGLHPHQAGVGHMTLDLGVPGYQGYLGKNCAIIAEVLRDRGYRTLPPLPGVHRPALAPARL